MEQWPKSNPAEKERKVETFATAVANELKNQVAGKQFTLTSSAGVKMIVTVVENVDKKGSPLWDSQVPGVLYVREPKNEKGVICFFDKLIKTPEASALITNIMRQKNVPQELQAEVKSKMLANYQK